MSYDSERAAVQTRFKSLWVDGNGEALTPVQYEGVAFTPPVAASWARLTLRNGDAVQASVGSPGSNLYRSPAVAFVELFSPKGQGTAPVARLGDAACDIFRTVRVALVDGGTILFDTPSFTLRDAEPTWERGIVKAPFFRDELH